MENQSSTQLLISLHFVGNGAYQQIMCGCSQQGDDLGLCHWRSERRIIFCHPNKRRIFFTDSIIKNSLTDDLYLGYNSYQRMNDF